MAATFVSSAVPTGNPTTSFTITIPTVAVDDLLILANTNGGATTAPTVTDNDTGGNAWAQKSSAAAEGRLYWKRATSATSAKTITSSGNTNSCSGVLFVVRGAITSGDPFDFFVPEENLSANEVSAGGTPSVDGCYIGLSVHNGASNGDVSVTSPSTTSPGALTDFAEKLSTGGVDCACAMAGRAQATATATGNFTWAQTDLATTSHAFAIKPQPATQALTPTAYTDDDTFYTQVVGVGAVNLSPTLFEAAQTFYTQVVEQPAGGQDLTPTLFEDGDTFYTQTVGVGAVDLAPTLYADDDTFYTQAVGVGAVDLAPDLFANSNTFYTQTVQQGAQDLAPDLFEDADTFYTQAVSVGAVDLAPSLFEDGDTFYTQTVGVGAVDLAPELFEDADTFYTQTVTAVEPQDLTPDLFANDNTFYAATVSQPAEESTGGGSYIPGLVEGYRARKERRRKAEERLWETARETYRQLHGIAREAPEALPEAIQEEIKELVAPAVKARAAKRAQATLPAPSTINWNAVAVHITSVERLTVILEQIENERLEDEDDDEDFLFMAA
jgi:hypothetical protein